MTEKNVIPIRPQAEPVFRSDIPEGRLMGLSERNQLSFSQRKLEKRIVRLTAQAITDFKMIEEGDKVMVAMSGGKDSYVLLDALRILRERAPISFELVAVNVDQHIRSSRAKRWSGTSPRPASRTTSRIRTPTASFSASSPEGKNVCSLCARLRRGILYRVASEMGCNKIALGHHMDDIVGTLMLNLFYGGRMKAMPPILRSDDKKNVVIRPLAYVREYETEKYAKAKGYPLAAKGDLRRRRESQAPGNQGAHPLVGP